MRLPMVLFASLAALALAGCSGCATRTPIPVDTTAIAFSVERAATLARASHAVTCEAVVTAHTAKVLTGANFNTAKSLCVQSDSLLDSADAALVAGDRLTAATNVKAALAAVDSAKALTPKGPGQ